MLGMLFRVIWRWAKLVVYALVLWAVFTVGVAALLGLPWSAYPATWWLITELGWQFGIAALLAAPVFAQAALIAAVPVFMLMAALSEALLFMHEWRDTQVENGILETWTRPMSRAHH